MQGFWLIGINPYNDIGESLRMYGFLWFPLWAYVCDLAGPILTESQKNEAYNENDILISEKQCLALVSLLKKEIESGRTARHEQKIFSDLEIETDVCDHCLGKGCDCCCHTGYNVDLHERYDSHTKEYIPSRTYVFYEDVVKKLVVFLEYCGGFYPGYSNKIFHLSPDSSAQNDLKSDILNKLGI